MRAKKKKASKTVKAPKKPKFLNFLINGRIIHHQEIQKEVGVNPFILR